METANTVDRRRFLLLAALALLGACAPVVTSEREPAESDKGVTVAPPLPAATQEATAAANGEGAANGPDVALQSTATPLVPQPDSDLPNGSEPPQAPPVQPPVPSLLNTHGDRSRRLVALTFDACETPNSPAGYDARVVQILLAAHAPATMFLCGHWVSTHSAITRTLAANPLFELGNHSWGHPDFSKIKPATMALELNRTQALVYQLTGRQPTLFRMPYGNWSPAALAEVSRTGLHTIQWDVVTGDPDPHVSAPMIIKTVQQKVRNGSIIIMHMNGRGVHTAEALPTVIHNLRSEGYILATVPQVLGLVPLTI